MSTAMLLPPALDASTDLFCGAGGSGLGAQAAGIPLYLAANHWKLAIETHEQNFPDALHDIADISQVDPRRYRRTRYLWASPECTNHSQAKGKKRAAAADQAGLFGDEPPLPLDAEERSRATMWDVVRFAEHHLYDIVIVENVVEAAKWIMFDAWLMAMQCLGYRFQQVFLNSMHAPAMNAPRAPQSRDRMYVVFSKLGNPVPDLDIRPKAWCPTCVMDVDAVQSWKKDPGKIGGKYRSQYVYRCPRSQCRFSIVEPYVDAASTAIDWSLRGKVIGDRERPLADKTRARIAAGLRRYGRAMTFEARGNTFVRLNPDGSARYARAWPVDQPTATLTASETRGLVVPVEGREGKAAFVTDEPMRTQSTRAETGLVVPAGGTWNDDAHLTSDPLRARTTRETDALVVPYYSGSGTAQPAERPMPTMTSRDSVGLAFIGNHRGGDGDLRNSSSDAPVPTVTSGGNHLSLTTAPPFITELRGGHSGPRSLQEALACVTASGNHHGLVEPPGSRHLIMRNNQGGAEMSTPVEEPFRTMTTAGHQSLIGWSDTDIDVLVDDCEFRMLEPAEIGAAMAFRASYAVKGTRREQVRQYGNAVTPPASEWLYTRTRASLEGVG